MIAVEGGKKTTGKDLRQRCYTELTKRVQGIYGRRMREKRRAFTVGLPDRKQDEEVVECQQKDSRPR
jgi:hypothetical protein